MVYKLGKVSDLKTIQSIDHEVGQILWKQVSILSTVYGEDRDVDCDDGGYLLYAERGTPAEEIKAFFDYSKATAEQVDVIETSACKLYSELYLTNNEYGITLILHEADVPKKILEDA